MSIFEVYCLVAAVCCFGVSELCGCEADVNLLILSKGLLLDLGMQMSFRNGVVVALAVVFVLAVCHASVLAANFDCNTDTDILTLLHDPFSSVEDTEARLACLQQIYLNTSNPNGVFLAVYLQVTVEMKQELANGFFIDRDWVSSYLVRVL